MLYSFINDDTISRYAYAFVCFFEVFRLIVIEDRQNNNTMIKHNTKKVRCEMAINDKRDKHNKRNENERGE